MKRGKKRKTPQNDPGTAERAGSSKSLSLCERARTSGKEWLALAAILAVGVLLRASYLSEIVQAPDFDRPLLDPQFYDYWARALVSGDWTPPAGQPDPLVASTPFTRPPGYPYFLALVYLLTGRSYLAIRLVQMGLGLVNAVLVFLLGRALFGRAVGLLTAAFMAVYWIFIYFEGELNSPPLVIFLVLCAMHFLRLWPKKITVARALVPGLFLGALIVVRPEALLFVPVLLAWAWWVLHRNRAAGRFVAAAAWLLLGVALMIAPVTLRNYIVGKEFVLIATGGGFNFYAGNNELSNGTWPQVDMRKTCGIAIEWGNFDMPVAVRALEKKLGREHMTHSDFSRHFAKRALEYIRGHPRRIARLVGKKAALFWGPGEISNNKVIHFDKLNSRTLRYLPGFPAAVSTFLLGLFLFVVELRRSRQQERISPAQAEAQAQAEMSVLFLLYVATCFFAILPFHLAARYRVPIMPFLLLFSAYALCRLGAFFAARDFRRGGLWALAGLGLFGFFSIPLVPYEQNLGQWHHDRALAYRNKGEDDLAIRAFRNAIEANPNSAYYHVNLGAALKQQGDLDGAIRSYRRALQLNPHLALAHNNLGHALYEQGKLDDAIAHYQTAIQENFEMTLAYLNLGVALLDQGKPEEAIDSFAKVIELDPDDRFADYHLARARDRQGRTQEALTHYKRALHLNPSSPGIHNKIAMLLAEQGKRDTAIEHLRRALELDPGFAPAYLNLAVALAESGRFREALDLYAQGLDAGGADPDVPPTLGALLERQGKTQEAAAVYTAMVQEELADAQTHTDLGNLLLSQGKPGDAIRHYLEALKIDPVNRDACFNLGAVLAALGRADEAAGFYVKALEIDPGDADTAERLGALLTRQPKLDAAGAAHTSLGDALAAQGKIDAAIRHYETALEIDRNDAAARERLEQVLAHRTKGEAR